MNSFSCKVDNSYSSMYINRLPGKLDHQHLLWIRSFPGCAHTVSWCPQDGASPFLTGALPLAGPLTLFSLLQNHNVDNKYHIKIMILIELIYIDGSFHFSSMQYLKALQIWYKYENKLNLCNKPVNRYRLWLFHFSRF